MSFTYNPFSDNLDYKGSRGGNGDNYEPAVSVATTGNLNATYDNGTAGVGATLTNAGALAAISIDGVSPVLNSRVLVKDQLTIPENGIYTVTTVGDGVTPWVLTRAQNYDSPAEINPGDVVPVINGTVNAHTLWEQTEQVNAVGVDNIIFALFTDSAFTNLVGDDANVVTPDGSNNINYHGATVANASFSKPLYISGTPASNLITTNIQVTSSIGSAPADFNDAGIASFDSTYFNVSPFGYVTAQDSIIDTATANYIVDPTGEKAEYTTITAAIAAASAGDTIFIKEGTYTEDLTLKAGVNLVAYGDWGDGDNVTIAGLITASFSGRVLIKGIKLVPNASQVISMSTGATLTLFNCRVTSNGLSPTELIIGTGGTLYFTRSSISASENIKCYTSTGMNFIAEHSKISWSVAVQRSTSTAGQNVFKWCELDIPITTSGTATSEFYYSHLKTFDNSTFLISGGTNSDIHTCRINTGTATAITATTSVKCMNSTIATTNAAAIDGAGSLTYGGLSFDSTGSGITTTTQTIRNEGPNRVIGVTQGSYVVHHDVINDTNSGTGQNAYYKVRTGGTNSGTPYVLWEKGTTRSYAWGMSNGTDVKMRLHTIAGSGVAPTTGTELQVVDTDGSTDIFGPRHTVSYTNAGGSVYSETKNLSNTAGSDSYHHINVGGTSAGDPYLNLAVGSTTAFSIGLDNSASDKFCINYSASSDANPSSATQLMDMGSNGSCQWYGQDNGSLTLYRFWNLNNTAGSGVCVDARCFGASADADAYFRCAVEGVVSWSMGVDNSDSDSFKISKNGTLGTNDYFVSDTSGNIKISGGTGYVQLASGTTAQRPVSPAEGMIRGNTTNHNLEYYNGTQWNGLSSIELILYQAVASVADVRFDVTGNTRYKVVCFFIRPVTDTDTLLMEVSIDGGATWQTTGYNAGLNYFAYNSTTYTNSNSTANAPIMGPCSNASTNLAAFEMQFYPVNANVKTFNGTSRWVDTTISNHAMGQFGGAYTTGTVDAIRFRYSSGNISSCQIALYRYNV